MVRVTLMCPQMTDIMIIAAQSPAQRMTSYCCGHAHKQQKTITKNNLQMSATVAAEPFNSFPDILS